MANSHYSKMLSETISQLISSLTKTTESAQDFVKKLSDTDDKKQEQKGSQRTGTLFANVFTKTEQNDESSNMSESVQRFSDELNSIEDEWSEKLTACF